MAIPVPERKKLGEILVARGILTPAQLESVLEGQGSSLLPLASTALTMKVAEEAALASALAEQFGVPGVELSACTVPVDVLGVMPPEVASAHHLMPLAFKGNALLLAIGNPGEQALIDEIAFASGRGILPYVAPRVVLERSIRSAYEVKGSGAAFWTGSNAKTPDQPHIEVVSPPKSKLPGRSMSQVGGDPKIVEKLDVSPRPTPGVARAGGKPLVLAVDDEGDILDIIDKALSHKGMDVVRAMRGREALEKLQTHIPDIVLLDAMLPEIHGFEICHKIKHSKQFQHIPVIIISAIYTGWNFITDVKRIYGADDYMAKPFRVMEMVRKVEETLAKTEGRPTSPELAEAHKQADQFLKRASDALRGEDLEAALRAAEGAVQADPFDPRTHFLLGMALHKSGRIYEAISVYERVVELAPGQFAALKNLAVLYERQGFKAKAVETWMRALEASPSDAVRQTIKAHLIDLL